MDKEELKSKVDEGLGSTKLTISERTFSEELDDVLEDLGDDETANQKVIDKLVKRLKRIDGNLHSDVSAENKKYKEQFEKDWKEKHGDDGKGGKGKDDDTDPDEPAYFKKFREAQEARIKALEEERDELKSRASKEATVKEIKEGLKELFKKADVKPNEWILNQTLRDIEIPEKDVNIKGLVKEVEKAYYKNMKEAGFEVAKPRPGGNGGGKGNEQDPLWAKKKAREGFGKKD